MKREEEKTQIFILRSQFKLQACPITLSSINIFKIACCVSVFQSIADGLIDPVHEGCNISVDTGQAYGCTFFCSKTGHSNQSELVIVILYHQWATRVPLFLFKKH
jgi:hypothetical protein